MSSCSHPQWFASRNAAVLLDCGRAFGGRCDNSAELGHAVESSAPAPQWRQTARRAAPSDELTTHYVGCWSACYATSTALDLGAARCYAKASQSPGAFDAGDRGTFHAAAANRTSMLYTSASSVRLWHAGCIRFKCTRSARGQMKIND